MNFVYRGIPLLVLLGALNAPTHAATATECLRFEIKPNGDAQLINACSDPLNLLYCVESDQDERPCSTLSGPVITLHYGVAATLPGYVAAGKPVLHQAVCFYPQAPIDWKPGSVNGWGCKKTCVMC